MTCGTCGITANGTWAGWDAKVGQCAVLFSEEPDATYYEWVKEPHPDPAKAADGKKVYAFKKFEGRPRRELAEKYIVSATAARR